MKLAVDLLSPELLGDIALNMTNDILEKCSTIEKGKKKYLLTKSQIRKFYSEFKFIEMKLPPAEKIPDDLYSQIKLLKAKAIYNSARKNTRLPQSFVDFIEFCVESVKYNDTNNKKTFIKICRLFEAFVGYSSAFNLEQ